MYQDNTAYLCIELQLGVDKVIEIFNEQGLCGDDLFTVWNELNEGY